MVIQEDFLSTPRAVRFFSLSTLLQRGLPVGAKWELYTPNTPDLNGKIFWCSGHIDLAGNPSPNPLSVTRNGEYYPLAEMSFSPITDLAVNALGADYLVGDILTLSGGVFDIAASARVTSKDGSGGVTGLQFLSGGEAYTTGVSDGAATTTNSVAGAGCTLDMTWALASLGYVQPLNAAGKISLSAVGVVLVLDAAEAVYRLPGEFERPSIMELRIGFAPGSGTQHFRPLFTRSKDDGWASNDSHGGTVRMTAERIWPMAYVDGVLDLGSGLDQVPTLSADDRIAIRVTHTDKTNYTVYFEHNEWGDTSGFVATLGHDATTGMVLTDVTERFLLDFYSAWVSGTSTVTVKGIHVTDTAGQGI